MQLKLNNNNIKLGKKNKYKIKLNNIADNEDFNWCLIAIDGDNIGKIKKESDIGAKYVIESLKNTIFSVINEFNNINNINNNKKSIGFERGGDECSIFIYCKDQNKQIAEKLIYNLFDNIQKQGNCTISAGLGFLEEDETGEDFEDRVEKGLEKSKQNGKHQWNWV